MTSYVSSLGSIGLLLLRIGIGISFVLVHGWSKIFGGPELWAKIGASMSNFGITFAPAFWGFLASFSEFGGGILLIFGLFTRFTSFFMAFTMAVAMAQHLSKLDPWNKVIYPFEMFCIFIMLIFIGAGKYSLDYLFFNKRKNIP